MDKVPIPFYPFLKHNLILIIEMNKSFILNEYYLINTFVIGDLHIMKDVILWSLFIIPWLSLIFVGYSQLRKYMPVALFATVIVTLLYQAAYHYNWWREMGLFGWDKIANVPWVYSAYLVATIWIFKFTYRKFGRYLIVNLILDGGYIYIWYPIQRKLGMAEGWLPAFTTYLLMIGVSLLIYLYQMWQEDELFK